MQFEAPSNHNKSATNVRRISNPLSAILNCADLCTANHETIATLLDQIGQSLSEDEDMQQLMDDLRIEVSRFAGCLRQYSFVRTHALRQTAR